MAENTSAPPSDWTCSSFVCQVRCTLGIPHVSAPRLSIWLADWVWAWKKRKKKKRETAEVFECLSMCVCGPRGFPEIHQQSGFASVSFTPLLCGTGCLFLPLPIRHGRTELSDFAITFIVTKDLLHHLQIWTNFFHCFSLENNPN